MDKALPRRAPASPAARRVLRQTVWLAAKRLWQDVLCVIHSSGKKIVLLKACCLVKLVPLQSSYILAAEEAVLLLYKESQWRRLAIWMNILRQINLHWQSDLCLVFRGVLVLMFLQLHPRCVSNSCTVCSYFLFFPIGHFGNWGDELIQSKINVRSL